MCYIIYIYICIHVHIHVHIHIQRHIPTHTISARRRAGLRRKGAGRVTSRALPAKPPTPRRALSTIYLYVIVCNIVIIHGVGYVLSYIDKLTYKQLKRYPPPTPLGRPAVTTHRC